MWRGVKIDTRTAAMMDEVARRTIPIINPSQGGFSNAVGASAGTHGRAAIDISVRDIPEVQRVSITRIMREVGFAAWYRRPSEGKWVSHIHGVPIGGDLSAAAQRQVIDYKAGLNGLANDGPDTGPSNVPFITWEQYLRAIEEDKKEWDELATEAQFREIMREEVERGATRPSVNIAPAGQTPVLWSERHVLSWLQRVSREQDVKINAIAKAIGNTAGVDGTKLAAEIRAELQLISASDIVDEFSDRLDSERG